MRAGHDPKTPEEALTLVEEECAELAMECLRVVQAATKVRRFGWDGHNPELPEIITNDEALVREIGDVRCRTRQLLTLLDRALGDPIAPERPDAPFLPYTMITSSTLSRLQNLCLHAEISAPVLPLKFELRPETLRALLVVYTQRHPIGSGVPHPARGDDS